MATTMEYQDPYCGWSAVGNGNVTAHEILTSTSNDWKLVLNLGNYMVFRHT